MSFDTSDSQFQLSLPKRLSSFILFGTLIIFLCFIAEFTYSNLLPKDIHSNVLQLLNFTLIILAMLIPSHFSGTGVVLFTLSSCVLIFLCTLSTLDNTFIFSAICLITFVMYLYKSNYLFLIHQQNSFLAIEKKKELLTELKNQKQRLGVKIEALNQEVNRVYELRTLIPSMLALETRQEIYNLVIQFFKSQLKQGSLFSFWILKKNTPVLESFLINQMNSKDPIFMKSSPGDILNEWILTYGTPLLVNDIKNDYRFSIHSSNQLIFPHSRSIMASPLISEDRPLGLIRVDSTQENAFSQSDLRLLSILANLSSLELKNRELFEHMQNLSITDGLTELYLPRFLQEKITHWEKHPESIPKPLSIIMMDLDHFKNINDTFGHVVGDQVLIQSSRIIRKYLPETAMAIRYGGEEFALLLPFTNKNDALVLAEKIREAFHLKQTLFRREVVQVTVSLGIATYDEDGHDLFSILQAADDRLYQAKNNGRNQWVAS